MPCNLHTAVLLEAGADAECVDATLLHIETYTGVLALQYHFAGCVGGHDEGECRGDVIVMLDRSLQTTKDMMCLISLAFLPALQSQLPR